MKNLRKIEDVLHEKKAVNCFNNTEISIDLHVPLNIKCQNVYQICSKNRNMSSGLLRVT